MSDFAEEKIVDFVIEKDDSKTDIYKMSFHKKILKDKNALKNTFKFFIDRLLNKNCDFKMEELENEIKLEIRKPNN